MLDACVPVRYLKVTLLIGVLVALLVIVLYVGHCFVSADEALAALLQSVTPGWDPAIQVPLFVFFAFAIADSAIQNRFCTARKPCLWTKPLEPL